MFQRHSTHALAAGLGIAAAALLSGCGGDDSSKEAAPAAEQAEPQPAPQAEPQPAPEPAAQPQAEPQPAPQAQPQPAPAPQEEETAEEVPAAEATPVPAIPADISIPPLPADATDAVKQLHKAATDGDMAALNNLGVLYAHGTGVAPDAQKAFSCYYLAAEGGDAEAQFNLARCYVTGQGITPNVQEFFKWCNKAALNNQVNAQYMLGICYRDGRGVEANSIDARRWLQRATAQGSEGAARALFAIEHPGETFPADVKKQAEPDTAETAAQQTTATTSLADNPKKPEPAPAVAEQPAKPEPAAAGDDGYHILVKGESPATVAKKYKIPLKKLMEINHFTDKDVRRLQIGQKIKVKP